jgi:DNA-binding transcriptional MocR family regulator
MPTPTSRRSTQVTTIQHALVGSHTDEPEQRRRFVKLPTDILRDPSLSDAARLFYAEVVSYAWEALDRECYASHATLARDLGWSVQKVRRAARECRERGLIECRQTGRTNHYRPLDQPRVIISERSDLPSVITQTDHQWYPKKKKKKEEEEKRVVVVVLRAPPRSQPPLLRPLRLLLSPRRLRRMT